MKIIYLMKEKVVSIISSVHPKETVYISQETSWYRKLAGSGWPRPVGSRLVEI
jgi:hypothetical protein